MYTYLGYLGYPSIDLSIVVVVVVVSCLSVHVQANIRSIMGKFYAHGVLKEVSLYPL